MIEPTEEGRKLAADLANAEQTSVSWTVTDFQWPNATTTGRALARAATYILQLEADMTKIDQLTSLSPPYMSTRGQVSAIAAKYRKPKPIDPLVEALCVTFGADLMGPGDLERFRTELAKRGIELKERGE